MLEHDVYPETSIDFVLERCLRAKSWEIEVLSGGADHRRLMAAHGSICEDFPEFEREKDRLIRSVTQQRKAIAWFPEEPEKTSEQKSATSRGGLLVFSQSIDEDQVMIGAVHVDRESLVRSAFFDECDLVSYLSIAVKTLARARQEMEKREALLRLLSLLPIDFAIVDSAGKVVLDVSGKSGLRDMAGRQDNRTVTSLFRMATNDKSSVQEPLHSTRQPYDVAKVELVSGESRPLYIVPLPSKPGAADADYRVLLLPRFRRALIDHMLVVNFSLSPSEAKVVRKIAVGKKIRDISRELQLSEQTVRTYLKRAFVKMGVSSQSEMVAKITEHTIPLRLGASETKAAPGSESGLH